MSVVHIVGEGGSLATERTSFIGQGIPDEIKALPKHLKSLDKAVFRKILQVLVTSFKEDAIDENSIHELTDHITEERLAHLISGMYRLLRSALRLPHSSLKLQDFQDELHDLSIPKELIPDVTSIVFGPRHPTIDSGSFKSILQMPKLKEFKWRVDVAISSSTLNRVLEPSVLVEMKLSDGTAQNFEIPISKFHELRYSIAEILRDMGQLEQRNILQIQD